MNIKMKYMLKEEINTLALAASKDINAVINILKTNYMVAKLKEISAASTDKKNARDIVIVYDELWKAVYKFKDVVSKGQ